MTQMMKFDVFKVPFHPFNLVNNLKCFQYSFATIMYLTQSIMTFPKATFLCNVQLTSLILKTNTIYMVVVVLALFLPLYMWNLLSKEIEVSKMSAAVWNNNEIVKRVGWLLKGKKSIFKV